jgi:hypothetical protein
LKERHKALGSVSLVPCPCDTTFVAITAGEIETGYRAIRDVDGRALNAVGGTMATKKLTHCTFAIAAVLSAAAMLLPTTASAQYRHYRHSYGYSYPSYSYYGSRTDGYAAPAYRSQGNIYGGGLSYYGNPGYSSMDSNGQRRTGSDVGSMGGMGR